MRILKNYIDGDWVASSSDQSIDVVNPALQEVMAKVPYGPETKKDVAKATESAVNAFKEWRTVGNEKSSGVVSTEIIDRTKHGIPG